MPDRAPELLMPVSEEQAMRRFEIEALQRINDNLRLLNTGQAELVKGMHSIDIRLTRIESNSVSAEVAELKHEVGELKLDKASRSGAVRTVEWASKVGPWLLSLVLALVALAGWEHRV